jgi:NAD(P)-dependent dehydrogenase (short-subunit alcohol dehydrogenase family)
MPIDLTDRVCLITGAGSGIGAALALGFAKRGATVVATDVRAPAHSPDIAMSLAWDVTDGSRAQQVVKEVVGRLGKLDVLVANAGIMPREPWDRVTPESWRKVLAVDLDGVWHACRAAAEAMTARNYGKIVTVTSVEVRLALRCMSTTTPPRLA